MISAIPQDTKKKTKQSSQNITEPRKTDEEINESSGKFRSLFENSVDAIFVADAETKMLTDCNKSAEKLVGRSKAEILTMSADALHPSDKIKETMEAFKRQAEGKIEYVETEVLTKGGERIPVEINSSPFVFRGKTYLLGIFRDITERKQAEDASRASEGKYKLLVENLPQKIFLKDRNLVYVSCNENYARDLKIKAEEIKGKTDYDFYPKELAEKYRADDKKIMEKGETADLEEKYLQDGKEFFVYTIKTPIKDKNDTTTGILGIFWDITERKRTEEQLKFKTAILEAESEASVDGILFVDENGKTTLTNKRFGEMWGIPQEVLDTKDDEKMLQYVEAKLANPDEFIAKVKYLYTHKDEKSREEIKFKDGEVFERYSAPLIDTEHKYFGRIWYFHDITALKRAEIELRAEKAKLEKYFDVIGIIALVLGIKGEIFLLNKKGCEMLGYQPNEVIGKNWITDFLSKDKKAKPGNFLGRLLKDGTDSVYFEHSVFTKDGKEKNITWGSTPIRDEAGNIQAFMCAGEDVTILRQAEVTITQLKEFDRLKDEFLNIAAHELKTPLTSIIGLSEIIKAQKTCLPSQMAEYPDIIYNEGLRLGRVVRRILTITRYESGKEVIHPEPINLTVFISALLPGLDILTKDKKVTIATNLKEENLQIESDKEMISEVIINLVDNSIKYGPENQTVTVSACRIDSGIDKGMVRIEVADQGPGIPPDSVNKLFNKFSQLEPSLSRSQEGAGLGLYICKLIVEKLGGRIGVESEVGKGSKFFFNLPLICPST
jgi:PAS domain S-box-containing protein